MDTTPKTINQEPTCSAFHGAVCSFSEFACQYWHDPKGWCESNVWATESEAVDSHNRIKAIFLDRRYRVIERVTTERVICETNVKEHTPLPATASDGMDDRFGEQFSESEAVLEWARKAYRDMMECQVHYYFCSLAECPLVVASDETEVKP